MSASLRGLALLCSALLVQDAWACRVPPANQLMGVDEQIALAADEGDRWLAYVKAGLARRAAAPAGS